MGAAIRRIPELGPAGTGRRKDVQATIPRDGGSRRCRPCGLQGGRQGGAGGGTIAITEVKPGEDVFAYISRVQGGFDQTLYQQVIGAANDFKEGDQAIGVGAADEATRENARALLANTKIKDLHEHPLLVDDLQQLIWQTTDQAQYAKVRTGPWAS